MPRCSTTAPRRRSWDYNVAPTTIQTIVRNSRDNKERELVSLRWGLIPFITKNIKDVKGLSTINARAETIGTARSFREPFKKRRCLVPASGFYEWKRLDEKNKQPFAFDLANGKMMAFAGLWDAWKDPANGQWLQSYTIITTDANELMAKVHDRMPVILHLGDFDRWLERDSDPARPPIDLLRPFPAGEMEPSKSPKTWQRQEQLTSRGAKASAPLAPSNAYRYRSAAALVPSS